MANHQSCQSSSCAECPSRRHSIFDELTPDELTALDETKSIVKFRKRQTLFNEGELPEGIFCIKSGRIKVFRRSADGSEHLVYVAGQGDALGYTSIIKNEASWVTAEVLEESEICLVRREGFMELLSKSPSLMRRLLERISDTLDQREKSVYSLSTLSVRERVAETLLVLSERYGVKTEDGIRLDIRLTREELASLAGTVLESAVRVLSDFKSQGLISLDGRNIELLKTEEILKIARP